MSEHTPGPWDWTAIGANASGGFHVYITDGSGRKIAALWGKAEEKEANARLVAAAPELLEALTPFANLAEKVERFIEARAKDGGDPNMPLKDLRLSDFLKARTAIAKAKGE